MEACREGGAQLAEAEGGGEGGAAEPAANGSLHHPGDGDSSVAASSSAFGGPGRPSSPHSGGCAELAADQEFADAMSEVRWFVC